MSQIGVVARDGFLEVADNRRYGLLRCGWDNGTGADLIAFHGRTVNTLEEALTHYRLTSRNHFASARFLVFGLAIGVQVWGNEP